jgi:RNA polymerase primary sigma factor
MTTSLRAEIERVLSTLTEREAEVITLYFGINRERALTLEEIGERFGLTRERVRQIKEKAIKRLKHSTRRRNLSAYVT